MDETIETPGRRAHLLAAVPLFRGLSPGELERIGDASVEVSFGADQPIVRQGEIGTGFFLIVDGRARVVRDGEVIARLGPGEFFGELSLVDRAPRIAGVVSDEPTRCLALASWEFERVLLANPSVALALLREVTRRLRTFADLPHG